MWVRQSVVNISYTSQGDVCKCILLDGQMGLLPLSHSLFVVDFVSLWPPPCALLKLPCHPQDVQYEHSVLSLLSCASTSYCPFFTILLQIIRPCAWDLHQVATQVSQHLQLAQPEQVPHTIPSVTFHGNLNRNKKWSRAAGQRTSWIFANLWIIMNHNPVESRFSWALWVTLYPTHPRGLYRGRWLLCGLSSYELPPSTLWATYDGGLHWCSRRSQCRVGDAFRAFSRCHGGACCLTRAENLIH